MLTEQRNVDKIEVVNEFKVVQVREKIDVYSDGEFLYQKPDHHRYVIAISDYPTVEEQAVYDAVDKLKEAVETYNASILLED